MPDMPPVVPMTPVPPITEPEIVVIPEKFYGAALKARVSDFKEDRPTDAAGLVQPPARSKVPFLILGALVVLFGIGGVFVYLNRALLFPVKAPPPTPVVETPAPVVTPPQPAPSAPSNVIATSTNPQSAVVSWIDTASNEAGYRIERAEAQGPFVSLTNLPPNSTSFQDASVSPGTMYRYRIFATNQTGDSTASPEASASIPALPPPPPEAPKLPPAGLDTDSDGLSDIEEALFGTNARVPDTDADGFLDGNELFNLYNPNGRAPGKLIDAGLVKEVKGAIGWTMNIPTPWTIKFTNADGSKATIETGHPEMFTISIEDNPNNLNIVPWYVAGHPGVQESQILQFRSKKGYEGIIGADLLTTYIPWGNHVFVFNYDLKGQPFINYRTTYSMMLNSLVLTGLPQIVLPVSGAPLPFEPAATVPGVITQPESIFPTASTATIPVPVESIPTPVAAVTSTP